MNNIIPAENKTFRVTGEDEEQGLEYNLQLIYCGKKLSSNIKGAIQLIELIDMNE